MPRMFGSKKHEQKPRLFRLTLHIRRGINQEMPSNMVGAYVPVFVAGENPEAGARGAVSEISRRGFEFVGIPDGKIHELDPDMWDEFVNEAWPEFTSYFPSQSEVCDELSKGFIFVGPFAGYDASESQSSSD
ncbi:hypothetical protein [Burkholderia metallica]|uniref:hypothetical protein n=1 Tax=Burkholderia metallica TaxID=488729 RepID=UPI000AE1D51D|nr:hypothetical protein [Burkholderia metallica]